MCVMYIFIRVYMEESLTHTLFIEVTVKVLLQSSLSLGGWNRSPGQLSSEGVSRSSAVVPNNSLMCTSGQQVSNNIALLGMQSQQGQQQHHHQQQQQLQEQPSSMRQLSLGTSNGNVHSMSGLPHGECTSTVLLSP